MIEHSLPPSDRTGAPDSSDQPPTQASVPAEIDRNLAGKAANVVHQGISFTLNLPALEKLGLSDPDIQEIIKVHEFITRTQDWKTTAAEVGYDQNTIYKVVKGMYEGSYKNVIAAMRSFNALQAKKAALHKTAFVPNAVTKAFNWALDYAMARSACVLIVGEAGIGKTEHAKAWQRANNHGRSVLVECLPIGGVKGFLRQIGSKVGVGKTQPVYDMFDAIVRAFNKSRMIIFDEAHQLLPPDPRTRPTLLETARRIHDITGCAMAFISTARFGETIKTQSYMFEQVLGRTGRPFVLPKDFTEDDIVGIIKQYLPRPTAKFIQTMRSYANNRDEGRLRNLLECLTYASVLAHSGKQSISEDLIYAAINLRKTGGIQ